MIPRKKKKCNCGCGNEGYLWADGKLKMCYYRNNAPRLKKVSAKQQKIIKDNKEYYRLAIEANKDRNSGICVCEECGTEIYSPTGSNVSHIISKGANTALYHDRDNHFILCQTCENQFSNIDPTKMRIWRAVQERKVQLLRKYYEVK